LLTNAVNETNRLNRLIEDVLLANNADTQLNLNKESVNLSELTAEILVNYFTGKNIKSKIESGITGSVDKLLFPSLLINLAENAIKYSPENAEVIVILNKKDGKIKLSVSDFGSGIPDNEKPKIFEKFYRIGNEETRRAKGTGLGLYIVQRIVEAHNGKIEVTDNKPNGSVFEISI